LVRLDHTINYIDTNAFVDIGTYQSDTKCQMSKNVKKYTYVRHPKYIFYGLTATGLFFLSTLFALREGIGIVESSVANIIYSLPSFFTPVGLVFYILGSAAVAVLASIVLLFVRRADAAIRVFFATVVAYGLTTYFQNLIERPITDELIPNISNRIDVISYGFPTLYAAVSVAAWLTIGLYLPLKYRRWLTVLLFLVGISGMYLGINLPLDIVGGWTVGLFAYSVTALAFGSIYHVIRPEKLVRKLKAAGLNGVKLKPASVDARGSVPFFGEYEGGKIFVKVFNKDNNTADWLFKLLRRLQYRRLEDEVPSLTPKRAIEHEAYLTMLAKHTAEVRAPEVIGIFKVASNNYALVMKRIDAEGLNNLDTKFITDSVLDLTWQQILRLHEHRIIHKDLRAANVMIEKNTSLPWIIDFGFSECAVDPKAFYKDNVEFIASSATKIGAARAVAAALRALGEDGVSKLIPYMQYPVLSGATTTDVKAQKGLLEEIKQEMIDVSNPDDEQIKKAKLRRIRA
jgi:tRNA A-37 threonylcarbamoyl transferase component Bud32/membrane-associated phospholipid phosphatase